MNGGGQPDRFGQPFFTIPQGTFAALTVLGLDMNDKSAATQTYPSAGSSCSWIGPIGITVEMACL